MPALLIYLLKVNVALLLFCVCYYAVLRQLTFYTLNRVYLIIAIVFSGFYPIIDISKVVASHQKLVQPIQVIINFDGEAGTLTQPVTHINYWQLLVILYWLGLSVMAIRLLVQFWSLYKLYQRSQPGIINQQKVRIIKEASNPFSFWQSIFINPIIHSENELKSIIAHECVHVRQWHTLDIILAELSLIFYWFNPGAWLMKKAISENLEFITDREILKQGADAKSYQYSLLYTSMNTSSNTIVNHFNISTIKQRIMMMNAKKSALHKVIRYCFIAPAVLVLLLAFGTSKAALISRGFNALKKVSANRSASRNDIKPLYQKQLLNNTSIKNTNYAKSSVSVNADTPKLAKKFSLRFNSSDSTYYFLNGTPITAKDIDNLNDNDIASLTVIGPQYASTLLGNKAAKGAVFIVTKKGSNTAANKQLLQKIAELDSKGTTKETGIVTVQVPVGSANNTTINNTTDSAKLNITNRLYSIINPFPNVFKMRLAIRDSLNDPLFVIDNKIVKRAQLKQLNPDTIDNVVVLTGDTADALYGDKGKRGVFQITTKASKNK